MNDRYKFRVWVKEAKRMIYNVGVMGCERYIGLLQAEDTSFYHEDEVITMQCTGLKDVKGKLIYEGDIVSVGDGYSQNTSTGPVIYEDGIYWCDTKSDQCWISGPMLEEDECVEIIGNIHDTPELIK